MRVPDYTKGGNTSFVFFALVLAAIAITGVVLLGKFLPQDNSFMGIILKVVLIVVGAILVLVAIRAMFSPREAQAEYLNTASEMGVRTKWAATELTYRMKRGAKRAAKAAKAARDKMKDGTGIKNTLKRAKKAVADTYAKEKERQMILQEARVQSLGELPED